MNKILHQLALPVFLCAFASAAQAASLVVTFEDQPLDFPDHFNTDYFKYESGQMNVVDMTSSTSSGYASLFALTSNQYAVSNRFGYTPVSFAANDGGLFNLTGFDGVGAWGSQTLTVTGYLNGVATYSEQVTVTTAADSYAFTGFTGIDRFEVEVSDEFIPVGREWALTNIAVTTVPEPETYMMLLAGLGIVASVARRRQIKR